MNTKGLTELIDSLPQIGYPGADLIVTKDGETIYRHSSGYKDAEKTIPVSNNDLYWMYSATKVFTCTAAMRLVEEGKLDLSKPVSDYIPAFAKLNVWDKDKKTFSPAQNVMTVEHLFTMRGGLNYDYKCDTIQAAIQKEGANTRSIVESFVEKPLDFEPGTKFSYSLCHDVLAAVCEVASDMKFEDYLKKIMFDPMEMEDIGFFPNEEQLKRFAVSAYYDNTNGTSQVIDTLNSYWLAPHYASGGAGLFGTTESASKLMTTLSCDGKAKNGYQLLKPETIAMMEVNHVPYSQLKDLVFSRLYGYGWGLCGRVHVNPQYSRSLSPVGEFGWDGAMNAFAMIDRKNHLAAYFSAHVRYCQYGYLIVHPLIRNYIYE